MPNRPPAIAPHPDAAVFALAAKLATAWHAACVADEAWSKAPTSRITQRRADARMVQFRALLDALLAMRPTTPEGRKAQAEAIAPHYQLCGGQSDRVAAGAFAALGVNLMAVANFAGSDAQAA